MATFAIFHRKRGLVEILSGTVSDATRAAYDLTDAEVWLGQKIGATDAVALVAIPPDAAECFEVFVVPCVRYGKDYLMSVSDS